MSVASIIKTNLNASVKFSELCKKYFDCIQEFEWNSFLEILDSKHSEYLTTTSDFSVRLLCVIKITIAQKIGGATYQRVLTPIAKRCLYFIKKNSTIIPLRHIEYFPIAKKLAESLSTRARNILEYFTPLYLFLYIEQLEDIEAVIRDSQNCGQKTAQELLNYAISIREYKYYQEEKRSETFDTFTNIPFDKDAFITNLYKDMLATLSIRSKNILDSISSSYKQFLSLSQSEIAATKSCGKTSLNEIIRAQCKFRDEAIKILITSPIEFESCSVEYQYPFLTDSEISFCANFKEQNGRLPLFYILEKLIMSSEDRFSKYFIQLNGLNCEPLSQKEIAEAENITYERVRQILRKPSSKINNLLNNEAWNVYPFWLSDYFTKSNVDFVTLSVAENLSYFSYDAFIDLMCCMFGYVRIQIKGELAAVSKKLSTSFDFKLSIEDIENSLKSKSYINSIIPLNTFISPYILEYDDVCNCVVNLYKDIFSYLEYEITNDDCVVISSKRVDIENTIYLILKNEGCPLHIEELFRRFKHLFPEHKYKEPNRIRPAITASKRICPQGKSSTYALVEWNLYSGSRRDYANELLNASPIPIPRKELIRKIMLRFPESSEKSIASTISQSEQYELYVGDLLGLTGKEYPSEYIIADGIGTRKSFEVRLHELIDFFEKYHYSPQYSGDFDERSLQRWIYNTRSGRTKATKEQCKQLEAVFEKYADFCLSGDEYTFSKRCEDYQAFVNEYYELPTKETNLELTRWFESSMCQQYADKRKEMFENLLQELSDYGFLF